MSVDSAQNVYVAGYTQGQLTGATSIGGNDAVLWKYDKDGTQQWVIQYGTKSTDKIRCLTIVNDKIYPVLYTAGTMEGTRYGSNDLVVMQLDTDGNVIWTEQFGTSAAEAPSDNGEKCLTLDSTGNIYIHCCLHREWCF